MFATERCFKASPDDLDEKSFTDRQPFFSRRRLGGETYETKIYQFMVDEMLETETLEGVLKALVYYDIFSYPLTSEEIFRYMPTNSVTVAAVNEALSWLSERGYIFRIEKYYSIQNKASLVDRRVAGNERADSLMDLAKRRARTIFSFPFVRAVFASGSFSKNYMDEKSDLDFFIITKPNRLWIARMLLVVYKRLFLFNSHKYFCVNYFIDSDHLEIEEKNIFTATELATLVPLYGCEDFYKPLFDKNRWMKSFLPNVEVKAKDFSGKETFRMKHFLESVIDRLGADRWDTHFMNMTDRRWVRMYGGKYSDDDFSVAFKTKKYTSKNHRQHFQKTVTDRYREKLSAFAKQFNLQWLHD